MQVTRLVPQDAVRMDGGAVRDLMRNWGTQNVEELMCSAMEDLLRHTARMEEAYQACEFDTLLRRVSDVAEIADRIGLYALGRVAADVAVCAGQGDDTALAATLSRLMRQVRGACDEIAVLGPLA